jgi:DnaJ-class molecular chaperone
MVTAALGGAFEVPTIDGGRAQVKVPEGTQSGKRFRLSGKGMPVLRSKAVGDLYVQVDVETPPGIFIACPEYNAGITPLLKNTIDWISRIRPTDDDPINVFKTRVFALGAASPGGFGGVRGIGMTRQTLEIGLGALVLPDQILVPRAAAAFDERGHLVDKAQQDLLKSVVEKLARAARVLHGD